MDEEPHFLHLWDQFGSDEAIKEFLLNIFHIFNEFVSIDIYPTEWATMRVMVNNILLKALQVIKFLLFYQKKETFLLRKVQNS